MKFVLVKFASQSIESSWFRVPSDIEKRVTEYSAVLCETSAGTRRGIVYGIINVNDYKEFRSLVTNFDKEEDLVAVETYVNINDIRDDPKETGQLTNDILLNDLIYYVKNGKFKNEIVIGSNNELIDNGSTYKLHKLLGDDCVRVLQFTND